MTSLHLPAAMPHPGHEGLERGLGRGRRRCCPGVPPAHWGRGACISCPPPGGLALPVPALPPAAMAEPTQGRGYRLELPLTLLPASLAAVGICSEE